MMWPSTPSIRYVKMRWLTPTCGAARPAPSTSSMVSVMSATSLASSGPNSVTGSATVRSTGSPMMRIFRIAMRCVSSRLAAKREPVQFRCSLSTCTVPLGGAGQGWRRDGQQRGAGAEGVCGELPDAAQGAELPPVVLKDFRVGADRADFRLADGHGQQDRVLSVLPGFPGSRFRVHEALFRLHAGHQLHDHFVIQRLDLPVTRGSLGLVVDQADAPVDPGHEVKGA